MADNPSKQSMEVCDATPASPQQLPTREILFKTRKAELQKRCREMGLNNIWVRKDQLINMILQNTHLIQEHADESQATVSPATVPTPPTGNQLRHPEPTQPPHPEAGQPQNNNDSQLLQRVDNTSDCTQLFEPDASQPPDSNATQSSGPDDSQETHTTPHPDSQLPSSTPEAVDPDSIIASDHSSNTDTANQSLLNTTRQPVDNITQSSSPPLDASNNDQWRREFMEKVNKDILSIKSKLETKDSEIELLNTEMKTAYSVIETLQQRISHLETRERSDDKHEDGTSTTLTPPQCLLLGDTNLKHVRRSDLDDSCSVRTVTHANMDLLSSWVSEKLSWSPSHCVIYCGLYDVLNGKNFDSVFDNLGSLISNLKDKSSNVKIHVCQIAPVLMSQDVNTRITEYNENLVEWGKQNGVSVVKTAPVLTLGSGETDDMCFEEDNQIQLLNRLGIIKLLSTIDKQCNGFTLSKNWQKTKKNSGSLFNIFNKFNKLDKSDQLLSGGKFQYSGRNSEVPNVSPTQLDVLHLHPKKRNSTTTYANMLRNHVPSHRIDTRTPRWRNHVAQSQEPVHHYTHEAAQEAPSPYMPSNVQRETPRYSPTVPLRRDVPRRTETALQRTSFSSSRRGQETMWEHNMRNHDSTSSPNSYDDGYRYDEYWQDSRPIHSPPMQRSSYSYTASSPNSQQGCYNCGEHNHHQRNCRFDHRLRCALCHRLGHKQRSCKYNNNP